MANSLANDSLSATRAWTPPDLTQLLIAHSIETRAQVCQLGALRSAGDCLAIADEEDSHLTGGELGRSRGDLEGVPVSTVLEWGAVSVEQ